MVISCISGTFILTFPSTSFQILLLTSCPVLFFCIPNSPINPSHMCYSDMHGGIVILESYHHIRDHAFKDNWLSLLQRAPFLITPHLSLRFMRPSTLNTAKKTTLILCWSSVGNHCCCEITKTIILLCPEGTVLSSDIWFFEIF